MALDEKFEALRPKLLELKAERVKLTNPFDKIAFDNQRIEGMEGLPLGLLIAAIE